jgi:hypothetical protein
MKLPIQAPAIVRETHLWQVSQAANRENGLQPSCDPTDRTCYDSNGTEFCCASIQCCGETAGSCINV